MIFILNINFYDGGLIPTDRWSPFESLKIFYGVMEKLMLEILLENWFGQIYLTKTLNKMISGRKRTYERSMKILPNNDEKILILFIIFIYINIIR